MLKNCHERLVNTGNTLKLYGFVLSVIGLSGIIISTISLKGSVTILRILLKGKSYTGNEPYLAAVVLTLAIGIVILAWGFKNLVSSFKNMMRNTRPEPQEFENYDEIETMLVKKQIPPYGRLLEKIIKKDKSFIKRFLFFLGVIIIGLLVKIIIPAEFFWNFRLDKDYFSIPLFLVVILAAAAGIRLASFYIHRRINTRESETVEFIKSIKGENNPYDFVPQIEKALLPLQRQGKSPFVFRSGYTETEGTVQNTGKIHKKMLSETYPKPIPYARHPILYLFLLAAVMLFITGFLFLVKLPPDNISVLTVPVIAIDYGWTIVKGFILVFCGIGLLENVNLIFSTHHFESVLVFVEVEGVYEKEKTAAEKPGIEALQPGDPQNVVFRSDSHFKIYAAKLLTEAEASKKKRNVIDMSAEIKAEKAKELIVEVIENFGQMRATPAARKELNKMDKEE